MLVGGRQPAVLDAGTGRLAPLPIRTGPGDMAELDHAGGTTTVVLHNPTGCGPGRWRSAGAAGRSRSDRCWTSCRCGTGRVLAEDCGDPGGTGPCTLTGYGATGAVLWRRAVPRPLDLVRDTPYGLVVRTFEGPRARWCSWRTRARGAAYRVIGRAAGVLGADDRQVVFAPAACALECDLALADLDTGSSRFLPENPGCPRSPRSPGTVAGSRSGTPACCRTTAAPRRSGTGTSR